MSKGSAPLGILDSGIGGLTVANAIRTVLPYESFIYYGDTAHLPYGEKSEAAIQAYTYSIVDFLLNQGVKAVILACNSASAAAGSHLGSAFPELLIIDVVEPVARYFKHSTLHRVGIIGTRRTINSGIYVEKIKVHNSSIEVRSLPTPLLVPMIEEGFATGTISQAIIDEYLSHTELSGIQSLVLACTHFPLIKKEIEAYYNSSIEVVDTATITAEHIRSVLKLNKLLNNEAEEPTYNFYVSDLTPSFLKTSEMFYGDDVKLKQLVL